VPLLWALTALTATTLGPPIAAWTDRVGRVGVMCAGWAIYAVFYLLLAWSVLPVLAIWLLFAAYGVFMAATEGIERAVVADLVPRDRLGSAYGWFNLVGGLMLFPASLIFGWLWQSVDVVSAFGFSAACAAAAAILLPRVLRGGAPESVVKKGPE
jgi:MFS family permease